MVEVKRWCHGCGGKIALKHWTENVDAGRRFHSKICYEAQKNNIDTFKCLKCNSIRRGNISVIKNTCRCGNMTVSGTTACENLQVFSEIKYSICAWEDKGWVLYEC